MSVTPLSRPNRTTLRAVAVIVPAHDERELLGTCLESLQVATWRAREAGWRTMVLVVADACTDATRATARSHGVACLTVNSHNVGAARAAGAERALSVLSGDGYDVGSVYLLHTDADTVVPSRWIVQHLDAASRFDAVLGPVEIRDWTPRDESCARRYRLESELDSGENRVHGANLGVRADAYLRAGGFPALDVAEDRTLVQRLRASGESVFFDQGLTVYTSARISHRVRGGFSDHLSKLEDDPPDRTSEPRPA